MSLVSTSQINTLTSATSTGLNSVSGISTPGGTVKMIRAGVGGVGKLKILNNYLFGRDSFLSGLLLYVEIQVFGYSFSQSKLLKLHFFPSNRKTNNVYSPCWRTTRCQDSWWSTVNINATKRINNWR